MGADGCTGLSFPPWSCFSTPVQGEQWDGAPSSRTLAFPCHDSLQQGQTQCQGRTLPWEYDWVAAPAVTSPSILPWGSAYALQNQAVYNKTEHKPPKPRLVLLAEDPPPVATEGLWLTVNQGRRMGQLSLLLGRVQGLFCFPCGHCQQWKCQCQEWCHLQQTGASITVSLPTGKHRACQKYISHCSIQRPYASPPDF